VLSAITLVNRAGTMVLPFISLYLTQSQGFSLTQVGRLLSLWGLGSAIGAWVGGWMTDRIGSIRTQQLSLVASGVGFLWFIRLDTEFEISIAMFLLAIVADAFRPAAMAATVERAPVDLQARAFALLRQGVNMGMAIGPAFAGLLALYDYRWLFIADAATCWIAALLLALLLDRRSPESHPDSGRKLDLPRSPWTDVPFLFLLLLVFGLAIVFFQLMSTLPLYFREHYGFREDTIGLLLASNAALIMMFEMVLIHWAEKRDRLFLVGAGAFLVCLGFAMMPLGTSVAFAALTIAVWSVGEMLSLPLMNTIVADRSGPGNRGQYMGAYTMVFALAFIVAPLSGTFVWDRFGADMLWYGIGVLGLLLWGGATVLGRRLFR